MFGLSLWHWLILLVGAGLPALVAFIVVLRLKPPEGGNSYGPPSYPAASGEALVRGFRRMFVFNGRATRSEFWWFLLWAAIVDCAAFLLGLGAVELDGPRWGMLLSANVLPLIVYVPLLSVAVRRLQDANRSGLWVLLILGGTSALALIPLLVEPARGDDAAQAFT